MILVFAATRVSGFIYFVFSFSFIGFLFEEHLLGIPGREKFKIVHCMAGHVWMFRGFIARQGVWLNDRCLTEVSSHFLMYRVWGYVGLFLILIGLYLAKFVVCWVGDTNSFQVVLVSHASTSRTCKLENTTWYLYKFRQTEATYQSAQSRTEARAAKHPGTQARIHNSQKRRRHPNENKTDSNISKQWNTTSVDVALYKPK